MQIKKCRQQFGVKMIFCLGEFEFEALNVDELEKIMNTALEALNVLIIIML